MGRSVRHSAQAGKLLPEQLGVLEQPFALSSGVRDVYPTRLGDACDGVFHGFSVANQKGGCRQARPAYAGAAVNADCFPPVSQVADYGGK
jgi:hypothetical protein